MILKRIFFFCLLANFMILSTTSRLNAQENSVRALWMGFTIKYQITEKLSIKNTVLQRFRDEEKSYHNNFNQPFINYKLNKEHAFGLGYRPTWFEEIPDWHWIILEYKFNKKLGKRLKVVNRLWYQHALDHKDIEYRDFFRNHLSLHLTTINKITPFIGIEPWFQINDVNEVNRLRSLFGVNWKLHDQINLTTKYFHQKSWWPDPNFIQNVLVVSLSANITSF